MKTLQEIVEMGDGLAYTSAQIEEYRNSFVKIAKIESEETINTCLSNNPALIFTLGPILAANWFEKGKYENIYNLLSSIDLSGRERSLDCFNGILIRYFYYSIKHLNKPVEQLYHLLYSNKEYENRYSISVLTNAILENQINNQIYEVIYEDMADSEERCKYFFYLGIITLIKGDYQQSLKYLDDAEILNKSKAMDLIIKKYTIVCKLHLCDYSIFYPFQPELQPYFSLIGAVKRGDLKTFYNIIDEHQAEYFKSNLFFVVRRLVKVIIHEGFRKIAICYSRIRISDISEILGFDVNYFLYKAIRDGEIRGYIDGDIFYSMSEQPERSHCGEQIRMAVEVRKTAMSKMRYPEIVPLSYEKVLENENHHK